MVIFRSVQPTKLTPHASVHQSKDEQEGLFSEGSNIKRVGLTTKWVHATQMQRRWGARFHFVAKIGPKTVANFQIAAPVARKLCGLCGLTITATTTSAAPSALVWGEDTKRWAPKSNERTGLLVFNKPILSVLDMKAGWAFHSLVSWFHKKNSARKGWLHRNYVHTSKGPQDVVPILKNLGHFFCRRASLQLLYIYMFQLLCDLDPRNQHKVSPPRILLPPGKPWPRMIGEMILGEVLGSFPYISIKKITPRKKWLSRRSKEWKPFPRAE